MFSVAFYNKEMQSFRNSNHHSLERRNTSKGQKMGTLCLLLVDYAENKNQRQKFYTEEKKCLHI